MKLQSIALSVVLLAGALGAYDGTRDLRLELVKAFPPADQRWALLVCVADYDDPAIPKLAGPLNDCRSLRSAIARTGVPADHIIVLANDQPDSMKPTLAHIRRELSRLERLHPGLLFMALAGHGTQRGNQIFFLPYDAQATDFEVLRKTALEIRELREEILRIQARQVILLVDACRNDATRGIGSLASWIEAFDFTHTNARDFTIQLPEAFLVFFACSPGQRSFECPREGSHETDGCFTSSVARGIERMRASSFAPDTMSQVVQFVIKDVGERVRRLLGQDLQTPVAITSGYETGAVGFGTPASLWYGSISTDSTVPITLNEPPLVPWPATPVLNFSLSGWFGTINPPPAPKWFSGPRLPPPNRSGTSIRDLRDLLRKRKDL